MASSFRVRIQWNPREQQYIGYILWYAGEWLRMASGSTPEQVRDLIQAQVPRQRLLIVQQDL